MKGSNKDIKIGGGAFSNVYAKSHNSTKVVKKYMEGDLEDADKEISILRTIKNNRKKFKQIFTEELGYSCKSSLITIKDFYLESDNTIACIVFKRYICDLYSLNKEYILSTGEPMDIQIALYIYHKIMLGISELEFNGIIHGDLKPENVVIGIKKNMNKKDKPSNTNQLVEFIKKNSVKKNGINYIISNIEVKIIDFNKIVPTSSYIKDTRIQTIYYTPPEIILGNIGYNNSVDIWTAGCILYELLTGRHLFNIGNKKYCFSEEEYDGEDGGEGGEDDGEDCGEEGSDCDSRGSSEEDSGRDREDFEHLALLHIYFDLLGEMPKEILNDPGVSGQVRDIFFSNGRLMGTQWRGSGNCYKRDFDKFNNYIDMIFERTFKYNYKDRLTIREYYELYIRNRQG